MSLSKSELSFAILLKTDLKKSFDEKCTIILFSLKFQQVSPALDMFTKPELSEW